MKASSSINEEWDSYKSFYHQYQNASILKKKLESGVIKHHEIKI